MKINATHHKVNSFYDIPKQERNAAKYQFIILNSLKIWLHIVSIVMCVIVAFSHRKRYHSNIAGQGPIRIDTDKYPHANDFWVFESLPPEWQTSNRLFKRWLWVFSNDQCGLLGDPEGQWSNFCNGNEQRWYNIYMWCVFCRPLANLNSTGLYNCDIDNCNVEFWGNYQIQDKQRTPGWYFVKATDRTTGRKYYGLTTALSYNAFRKTVKGFNIHPNMADCEHKHPGGCGFVGNFSG